MMERRMMIFLGYLLNEEGKYGQPTVLNDREALRSFIKKHFDAPEMIITDKSDQQLLRLRDGVDLTNALDQFDIDLRQLFLEKHQGQITGRPEEKPEWERYYDRIGLSTGEIHMRQRAKKACKQAQTVADVADLVEDTYFIDRFLSPDGKMTWDYFDSSDFSVQPRPDNQTWQDAEEQERIVLSKNARVIYIKSGEDVHEFYLLDPPGQVSSGA